MTTSNYMPDVTVEVAFNAGVLTPAASRTWTDVSAYVELAQGIAITVGRSDRLSQADANELALTLDNRDGRFTAGRSASPYYPNVKLGRPIRVRAVVNGTTYTRFLGFVDEWPTEWDGTDTYARASIRASSRLARLGLDELRSIVEEEYALDGPLVTYPLGEPEGSTSASDTSGNGNDPLVMTPGASGVVPVVFGSATGPGTDELTGATFAAGGQALVTPLSLSGANTLTLAFWWNGTVPGVNADIVRLEDPAGAPSAHYFGVRVLTTGQLQGYSAGLFLPMTANTIGSQATGENKLVVVEYDTTTLRVYINGVLFGSSTNAGPDPIDIARMIVGSVESATAAWSIAQIAVFDHVPGVARYLEWYAAGADGFAGEAPGDRIERYATYGAVDASEVAADAGIAPMAHIPTGGQSVADLLRQVEETDGGFLFDRQSGVLTYRGRSDRYLASQEFVLSMTAHEVEVDYRPILDRFGLVNDATVTTSDGTSARVLDRGSIDDYGPARVSVDLATTDANEASASAWWRVNAWSEPAARVPSMSLDLLPLSLARQQAVLAAIPGSRFGVTGLPSQASATTGDYFIEGWTETIGNESWRITYNVTDAAAYVTTWVLQDATRGRLDNVYRIAY